MDEEYSDIELVDLAIDGDERAFEQLVQRHYLSVYHFSYKWCRVKEDAEEITQEVFVKLTGKLGSFRHESSFKTWLFRIVINTAKDYFRKNVNRKKYESAFENEHINDNPEYSKNNDSETDMLYFLIDRLPGKQKAALMLVMAEGLSHEEAAKVLKCSEKTISWRIHQARKRLKAAFPGGFGHGR